MVDVDVVVTIDPGGRITTSSQNMPDIPELMKLSDAAGGRKLVICPSKLVQDTLGVNVSALHQFVDRHPDAGVGRILVGSKRYLTLAQLQAVQGHYCVKGAIGDDHVTAGSIGELMSREKMKEIFGVGNATSIHEWLDDIFGDEKPSEKLVCGVRIIRHKPRSDIHYYIPKDLLDDEPRLREWGRMLYWEARRARLPKQYRGHRFTLELAQECGIMKRAMELYVAERGPRFGVMLASGMGREIDRETEKGTNQFLFSPEEAAEIRSHFKQRMETLSSHYTVKEFAERVNAPEKSLRGWVNANADAGLVLFGLALRRTPGGLRIPKGALTEAQYEELRLKPRTNAKLADIEDMLRKNTLPRATIRLDRIVEHYSRQPPEYEYLKANIDLLARQSGIEAPKLWEYLLKEARGKHLQDWDKWRKELGAGYQAEFGQEFP
ncbi:MAG: hypothetical protein V1875_10100 [Candidatus Altiarchaeota archaeon]